MVSKSHLAAVCGAVLVQLALAGDTTNTAFISSPSSQPTGLRSLKYAGCYNTAAPMIDHGPYTYQSSGNCQKICYLLGNTAMALGNGTDCWCGDMLPPTGDQVPDSQCNTACAGYNKEFCGGASAWTVYQTGFTLNDVPHEDAASASASASSKPTVSASPSASAKPSSGSSGSGSTVGIAVGVVVGIVVLAALAGAGFLFFRRRQQRQMEEYKQQVDAPSFFGSPTAGNSTTIPPVAQTRPSMWAPDNRLAGGNRNSFGSIADNQDYSRKILQVRNPDDGF